jgi:adenosylhomocysteine nucleosidase
MRVLVTFAVAPEFAAWRRRHPFVRVPNMPLGLEMARCPVYRKALGETEILVALTGIGAVRARRATRYALQSAPDVCISSGLAGALKETYSRGEVLAGAQVAELPGKNVVRCDPALLERAGACGARLVERFLTSPNVVTSAAAKMALGGQGDAVEMESAGVLAAASAANIPAVAIRVISDDAGQDLPVDFNRVLNAKGKLRPVRLLSSIAAEPARLRGLLQLAGDSRKASSALGEFLDRYIADLAARGNERAAIAGAAKG